MRTSKLAIVMLATILGVGGLFAAAAPAPVTPLVPRPVKVKICRKLNTSLAALKSSDNAAKRKISGMSGTSLLVLCPVLIDVAVSKALNADAVAAKIAQIQGMADDSDKMCAGLIPFLTETIEEATKSSSEPVKVATKVLTDLATEIDKEIKRDPLLMNACGTALDQKMHPEAYADEVAAAPAPKKSVAKAASAQEE